MGKSIDIATKAVVIGVSLLFATGFARGIVRFIRLRIRKRIRFSYTGEEELI